MTVKDLIALNLFELKNAGDDSDMEREITRVILAEDAQIDEVTLQKAAQQGITLFSTSMPIFEAALSIYQKLNP